MTDTPITNHPFTPPVVSGDNPGPPATTGPSCWHRTATGHRCGAPWSQHKIHVIDTWKGSEFAAFTTVWIATEFDINDGGRAWIQAAPTAGLAKLLCQQRHDHDRASDDLPLEPLTWENDGASKWQFGQTAHSARVNTSTCYYEVREVPVTTPGDLISDEQIGRYWDEHIASQTAGIPDDTAILSLRDRYIQDVRNSPAALQHIAEHQGEPPACADS